MKIARVLSAAVLLNLLVGGEPALADGWSLERLVPFGKKETKQAVRKSSAKPSPLEKFNNDMKKFNQGTKKFFTSAMDALSWKKPAAKKKPTRPYLSWIREPKDQQYLRGPRKEQEKSWWESLFRREEPKRIDSMKDWVGLPKPDM